MGWLEDTQKPAPEKTELSPIAGPSEHDVEEAKLFVLRRLLAGKTHWACENRHLWPVQPEARPKPLLWIDLNESSIQSWLRSYNLYDGLEIRDILRAAIYYRDLDLRATVGSTNYVFSFAVSQPSRFEERDCLKAYWTRLVGGLTKDKPRLYLLVRLDPELPV